MNTLKNKCQSQTYLNLYLPLSKSQFHTQYQNLFRPQTHLHLNLAYLPYLSLFLQLHLHLHLNSPSRSCL